MSRFSIEEPQPANRRNGRRRVLLFAGNDRAVTTAAPALTGLGLEVVHAEPRSAPIAPPADTLLAVVVSSVAADRRDAGALIRHLRSACEVPVLVLAPGSEDDVLLQDLPSRAEANGLVALELAHEISAILRRSPSRVLRFGVLEIDMGAREVRVERQRVELSRREFDLIAFLASTPGRAFTRRELLDGVWHSSGASQSPSTVTEHVRRLRLKLRTRPEMPLWLVTVRGTGYRFEA